MKFEEFRQVQSVSKSVDHFGFVVLRILFLLILLGSEVLLELLDFSLRAVVFLNEDLLGVGDHVVVLLVSLKVSPDEGDQREEQEHSVRHKSNREAELLPVT